MDYFIADTRRKPKSADLETYAKGRGSRCDVTALDCGLAPLDLCQIMIRCRERRS
jgi:hypothetical protein